MMSSSLSAEREDEEEEEEEEEEEGEEGGVGGFGVRVEGRGWEGEVREGSAGDVRTHTHLDIC